MFSFLPVSGIVKYMVQDSRTGIVETVANLNSTGREVCNPKDRVIGRQQVDVNLFGSASSGYGDQCCPLVVDPSTWLALIAGIALATFFLRLAIINNVPVGRRRRRDAEEVWSIGLHPKLPHFEPNFQALAGNRDWMSNDAKLIQGLATNWESKADNPSMLTPLGGLVDQMTRWKKEEDELEGSSKKTMVSSAEEEEESCLVSGWRCMSTVLEQGVTCFQRPRGFQSLIEKGLYKIAFHGRSKHIWESFMTIKEARSTAKCLRKYDLCTEQELIKKEATVYSRDGFYIVPSNLELLEDNNWEETESAASTDYQTSPI